MKRLCLLLLLVLAGCKTEWERHAQDCPVCGRFYRNERTTEEMVRGDPCVCDDGAKLYDYTDAKRAAANPDWREVPSELVEKYEINSRMYQTYWATRAKPPATPPVDSRTQEEKRIDELEKRVAALEAAKEKGR